MNTDPIKDLEPWQWDEPTWRAEVDRVRAGQVHWSIPTRPSAGLAERSAPS
jgi:hypothetical protein